MKKAATISTQAHSDTDNTTVFYGIYRKEGLRAWTRKQDMRMKFNGYCRMNYERSDVANMPYGNSALLNISTVGCNSLLAISVLLASLQPIFKQMKMDHVTYINITKAQQRKRVLFLSKNDVIGVPVESHQPKRPRLHSAQHLEEQKTVASAIEEAMEVIVDENNNLPEEKIHYFGPGRSWTTSWVYKSKEDLKKDLIQWEMTVFKSKCRIDEADRIEANALRALQDGYFDLSDHDEMTRMCNEMRQRGGPSLDEVLVYLEEWRDRMGDTDAAPFILPCGQRLGRGDSHDCKGSKGKYSLIHQKWIGH